MENLLDLKKEDIEKMDIEALQGLQFVLKAIIKTSRKDHEKATKLYQIVKNKIELM